MWMKWQIFSSLYPKSLWIVTSAMKLEDPCSLEEIYGQTQTAYYRDITLWTDVPMVKSMAFPLVMYRCECWTIKKADCWRTDAFMVWCWRRLLRVSSKEIKSVNSKEINSEYSLEGLMLKLQNFGHVMWTFDSLEKTLMLGQVEGKRRWGWQRMRQLDSITDSMNMNLGTLWETVWDM